MHSQYPTLIVSAMASSSAAPPYVVDECRGVLRVYSDGSIERSPGPCFPVPIIDDGSVEWKDVIFDAVNGLSLRLYRPRSRHHKGKFPIFYYFHGGGYCIGSRTWPNCQNYCLRLSSELGAIVIAPDYRLAPEHRLPAAVHDGVTALAWLRDQAVASGDADPWLAEYADFERVFVSGDSAGGNIAHHLALRFGGDPSEVAPVQVRGYVLLMPFFGGTKRTKSEAECPKDAFLNLELNDRYWRLSLPVGADTDDSISNPFGPASASMETAALAPMLVVVGQKDLLRDRAVEYAEKLKGWGKPVEVAEFKGQQHGFFTIDPWCETAGELMRHIKQFIDENSGGGGAAN